MHIISIQGGSKVKVFVANLRKYNEGEIDGDWYDLTVDDPEDILDEVLGLDDEGERIDEEIMVSDYDLPEELQPPRKHFGEYPDLEELAEFAIWFDGLSNHEQQVFGAIVEASDYTDFQKLQEIYEGGDYSFYDEDDWDDLGYEVFDSLYGIKSIPEHLVGYINFADWVEETSEYHKTSYGFIEFHN